MNNKINKAPQSEHDTSEPGRYTQRASENSMHVEMSQFNFDQWQSQLNSSFNLLSKQLEKIHLDLQKSLEDNMEIIHSNLKQDGTPPEQD